MHICIICIDMHRLMYLQPPKPSFFGRHNQRVFAGKKQVFMKWQKIAHL